MTDFTARETPYKGLVPYDETDAPFFFGREAEREIITANLMGSRLTLVYGPSGVGKSSVLRAGVVHDLRQGSLDEMAMHGESKFIVVFFNSWRDDPLGGLLAQCRRGIAEICGEQAAASLPSASSFADTLKAWSDAIGSKLLIILDQFEEYFLYSQTGGLGSFAAEFPTAVQRSDLRANFMISLREDWYTKLDRFKVAIPNIFDNNLRVGWLNREAARLAIEEPAKLYDQLRSQGEPKVTIKQGFSETVLRQLEALSDKDVLGDSGSGEVKGGAANGRSIQTPYLQLVMTRLWGEALQADNHALRPEMLVRPYDPTKSETRAEEIIQSHLDGVMQGLDPDDQNVASSAFYHLVTPGGTKIAQQIGDLKDYTGLPEATLDLVLEKLSSKEMSILSRLVPPPNRPANQVRYEVFHDVLAPAILSWRKSYILQREKAEATRIAAEEAARAAEEASAQATRAAAEAAAEAAAREQEAQRELEFQKQLAIKQKRIGDVQQQRAEEQAKAAKRFRWATIALAILTLFSLVSTGYAFYSRSEAERAKEKAISSERETQKAKEIAVVAQASEKKQRELAEERAVQANISAREATEAKDRETIAKKRAEEERGNAEAQASIASARAAEAERDRKKAAEATKTAIDNLEIARKAQFDAVHEKERADDKRDEAERAHKTDTLYREAFRLSRRGNKAEAITKFTEALEVYRADKDQPATIATLLNIGEIYTDLDNPKAAEDAFREAVAASMEDVQRASTLTSIGDVYRGLSGSENRRKAISKYEDATALYRSLGDKAAVARVLFSLGKVYAALFDRSAAQDALKLIDQALTQFMEAKSTFMEVGDNKGAIAALMAAGEIAEKYPSTDARLGAGSYFEQALNICRQSADRECELTMLRRLIEFNRLTEKFEKITDLYGEIAKFHSAAHDHAEEADALEEMASSYAGLKEDDAPKREKIIQTLRRALEIYQQTSNYDKSAAILLQIGQMQREAGATVEAIRSFEQALIDSRRSKNLKQELRVISNLTEVTAVSDQQKARAYLGQSVELASRFTDELDKIYGLTIIAESYLTLKETNKAERSFSEALALVQPDTAATHEKSDQVTRLLSGNARARLLGQIGSIYSRKNSPANAIKYLSAAAEAYRRIKDREILSDYYLRSTLLQVAEIYRKERDFKKALEVYEQVAREIGYSTEVFKGLAATYRGLGDLIRAAEYERLAASKKVRLSLFDSINLWNR